jgi:hypothetical protein
MDVPIPEDMRCKDLEENLAKEGIGCSAVVSIRDLLLLLGKPKEKPEEKPEEKTEDF